MANSRMFFSDFKSDKFWDARNVKHGGELMWLDLLMVDVNATINANRLATFRSRLTAGSMYSISGFDVCKPTGLPTLPY
ncbi:hypothetical protein F2Q70_00008458 [Brassica cretica]|uniref:Uncharacterized protein n=1 Tax=Brassica cretica TaxID=69181 RepID=A0A8S9M5U3_BRACR|nr:hypothetical protein F2Q70_00008458 [Brassica cretica]